MELPKITDEQRGLIMAIAETVHPLDFVQAVGLVARHRQKAEDDAAADPAAPAGRVEYASRVRAMLWAALADDCEGILAATV